MKNPARADTDLTADDIAFAPRMNPVLDTHTPVLRNRDLWPMPSRQAPSAAHDDAHLEPERFPLTEAGAAESFVRAYGDRVRFDYRRGKFLLWSGARWALDSDAGIMRLVRDHVRHEQHRAIDLKDAFERGKQVAHWMKFDRRAALDNLLTLAKAMKPIAHDGAGWDANPMLLGVPNGVIELDSGRLRPGQPTDAITMQAAVAYDPAARCPRWEQFIHEVFPDPDLADYVWRALGYSITGAMQEQVFFVEYGRGSNGKSTTNDTVSRLLGDYALTVPFSAFEQERAGTISADVASLDGRRFVTASESTGRWLHAGRLKDVTGGEQVSARFLFGNPFTFRPVCKIWLATNELPRVADTSDGLWRRLRQIPFTVQFAEAARDPRLPEALRDEAPGILAWLVRGALAWQERGLGAPAAVVEATAEYRADSDPLGRFIEEAIDVEPGAQVRASELYRHYQTWAQAAGLTAKETLTATMFGRSASDRFPSHKDASGRVYEGIARREL